MTDPALSLQLYSLRRETKSDPAGTLRKVPGLGFDGVELAGDYGWSAEQWRALLDETGLKVVGAHVGLEALETDLEQIAGFHRAIGNGRLVIPSVPHASKAAAYSDYARRFNEVAGRAQQEGFALLYHNHDFEFKPLEDAPNGIEVLIHDTDPSLVHFEFDTYWIERGGENAAEFVSRYASRAGMIHAKELRRADNADVPAGQGNIDFATILPLARNGGWPIVVEFEGENAPEAVRASAAHLRALGQGRTPCG